MLQIFIIILFIAFCTTQLYGLIATVHAAIYDLHILYCYLTWISKEN